MAHGTFNEHTHLKIAVLGAGNMGTALAHALASQGHSVAIWDHFVEVVDDIQTRRENLRYLPGVVLHANVTAHRAAADCVSGAALVIVSVPSPFIVTTVDVVVRAALRKDAVLLNVAKGFAPGSVEPLVSMLEVLTPDHHWVHLAGPCIANEVAQGQQALIVMASASEAAARRAAGVFNGPLFQCSVTTDVTGASLGGILKNVYAILLGCLHELNGDARNLTASAITACLAEMAILATAYEAELSTIYGLPGLGDLVATGSSLDSHNFNFGRRLASGRSTSQIEQETGLLPEGARAAAMVCTMARSRGIAVPLAEWVRVSIEGQPPALAGLADALRAATQR